MVDISTAMQAARAEGKRKSRSDGDSKGKPGGKLGIENFDPRDHVQKERAETISMWLMIAMGLTVALMIRYVMMPGMEGPKSVLWFLPVSLSFVIPTLHRVLIPEPFKSLYTFWNWFRGSMLYIFTWLALCFILVNPPLGDIAAPDVANRFTIVMVEDEWEMLIDYDNLTSDS